MKEKRSKESAHAHPGEVLRKVFLIPLGISQNRLAREIGVPPRRINEIVLEKRAVTADTAIRLARYFGTSEGFWMGLQAGYDLEKTHRLYGDRFEKEVKTGVSGIDGTVKSAFPSDSKACDAEDSKSALEDHGGRRGEADRE